MGSGIFSGRSALGTDDATGPTTQTLICPKGQAFVEGECVSNLETPPKADTMTTTTAVPAINTTNVIVPLVGSKVPGATPAASTTSTSIPWGWIALGVLALGGAWWVMGKGQEKRVRRNASQKRRTRTRYVVKRGPSGGWSIFDKDAGKSVNWHRYKADAQDAADSYNKSGYRKGHKAKHAKAKRRGTHPDASRPVWWIVGYRGRKQVSSAGPNTSVGAHDGVEELEYRQQSAGCGIKYKVEHHADW